MKITNENPLTGPPNLGSFSGRREMKTSENLDLHHPDA
jgi:hypothetical protein